MKKLSTLACGSDTKKVQWVNRGNAEATGRGNSLQRSLIALASTHLCIRILPVVTDSVGAEFVLLSFKPGFDPISLT